MKKLFTILLVLITTAGYSQTVDTVKVILPGGGSTIDTLPLSQRIDTNTVHIATNTTNIASNTSAIAGKENSLGNPSSNGYILSSTTAGARSWVPNGSGSSGTVTSVTGTAPIIIAGTPTTVPNVTIDTSKSIGRIATFSDVALKQNIIPNISDTSKYVKKQDSTVIFTTPYQSSLKANDNAVVHLAGTETISGTKRFNGGLGVGMAPVSPLTVQATAIGYNNGISLNLLANNVASPPQSYESIDFSVPTSGVIGQFFATASNYNAGISLQPNSIGLDAVSNQLWLAAINSSGYISFVSGGTGIANERMRLIANGNLGIGTTIPTALVHIASGTTTKPPFKINAGLATTTPQPGAIESDTTGGGINHLLWTDAYGNRYQLDRPLYSSLSGTVTQWNQNTTGTAANLSGTPVLNNGITATTQTTTDSSKLIATTEFVKTAPIKAVQITGRLDTSQMKPVFINLKDPLQLNATKDTMFMRTAYFDSLYSGAKTLQDVTDSGSITTNTITAANLNLTNIQEFSNQHAAILSGLSNGDIFRLPADGNGNHLLAIVDSTAAGLTFTVDNSSGSYAVNSLYFGASSTFSMRINWGDGIINDYSGATSYNIHHTYATSDTFNVIMSSPNYSAIKTIYLNYDGTVDEKIRNLKDFSLFTALYDLDIHRIHLTDINSITLPNSINNFTCGSNDFTNFNRSLPSSMVSFSMSYTTCSSFTSTNYPNTIKTFYTNSNALTTTDINGILVGLNTAGVTGATINTSGNSAPPSGAGATAKTSLISAGNTVTTD